MNGKPKRRWLRFSVRTLLAAITILCVWLGWQVSIVRERQAVLAEIRRIQAPTWVDKSLERIEAAGGYPASTKEVYRVSWSRRLLGDESWFMLELPESLDPKWIERAEYAFPEAQLVIFKYGRIWALRDALYGLDGKPMVNSGTVFKTGVLHTAPPK